MNKREAKHKYLDRWVGLRSEKDGMTIANIKALSRMLEEDDCYVLVRKIWWQWLKRPFKEWCIVKVCKDVKNISYDKKLASRVYALKSPKRIKFY